MVSSTVFPARSNPLGAPALSAGQLRGYRELGVIIRRAAPTNAPSRAASRASIHRRRHQFGYGLRYRSDDVAAKLAVFPRVLLFQSEAVILVHIGASKVLDFLHDVKQNFFRAPGAWGILLGLPHVSSSNIRCAINRESDAVRHLLAPALSVKSRIVPRFLASVNVDPTLLVFRIHLRPDMVLGVPNPAYPATDCSAEHAEAVCPLAAPSASCLQEPPYITVSWKALESSAVGV